MYRSLGPGMNESIYHKALVAGLRYEGVSCMSDVSIPVRYKDIHIGHVRSDIVMNDLVVELKSTSEIPKTATQQAKSYMRLLGIDDGLVVNFSPKKGVQFYEVTGFE